jgi:hypothetical protein
MYATATWKDQIYVRSQNALARIRSKLSFVAYTQSQKALDSDQYIQGLALMLLKSAVCFGVRWY